MLGALIVAIGQPASQAILTNLDSAKWTHEKGDPAGSQSVLLREDPNSGGMES